MAEVTVVVDIDRSPSEVWSYLSDIAAHVEWMADAVEIRFTSETTQGPGTSFECLTRIGPIKLIDAMTITSWEVDAKMGVRHEGLVSGVGEFRLTDLGAGRTSLSWHEDLSFPLRLGGRLGELVAKPILTRVWRRNLKRLKARLEESHR